MSTSAILCTYNGQKYLQTQIDSILNQTEKIDEIIICDDQSTDSTHSILNTYQEKNPNLFKIFINEKQLGSSKNFEKALNIASGDFIFFSDQDDIWVPEKVKTTLKVFEENPMAEGVFSNAELIDENNNILLDNISLWDSVCFFESKIPKPINLYRILILKGNYVTGATLCIKKSVKDFCLPFNITEKTFLHDEWLAYLLSKRNTLFYSSKKLIHYRIHNNQQVGLGNILKNIEESESYPEYLKYTLGLIKPKTYKEYKNLARILFIQYNNYKNKQDKTEKEIYEGGAEKELLNLYLEVDACMRKTNPILYFFRKLKDKRKGERQL